MYSIGAEVAFDGQKRGNNGRRVMVGKAVFTVGRQTLVTAVHMSDVWLCEAFLCDAYSPRP